MRAQFVCPYFFLQIRSTVLAGKSTSSLTLIIQSLKVRPHREISMGPIVIHIRIRQLNLIYDLAREGTAHAVPGEVIFRQVHRRSYHLPLRPVKLVLYPHVYKRISCMLAVWCRFCFYVTLLAFACSLLALRHSLTPVYRCSFSRTPNATSTARCFL